MGKYITASGSATVAPAAEGILITVNAALIGTITVQAGGNTIAIITNPTVGSFYRYLNLTGQGAITVNPSATTDIYVNNLSKVV